MLLFAPIVAILIVAQIAWILRSDAAFEEAATTAAEKARAAIGRFQRMGAPVVRSRSTRSGWRRGDRPRPRFSGRTGRFEPNSAPAWIALGALVPVIVIVAGRAFADGDPAATAIGFVLTAPRP